MTQNELWAIVIDKALLDRADFLKAWEGCDAKVEAQTELLIEHIRKLKGVSFRAALLADRPTVREAFLSAELWYKSLSDAQVGQEAKLARATYLRINALRVKTFGRTKLEQILGEATPKTLESLNKADLKV